MKSTFFNTTYFTILNLISCCLVIMLSTTSNAQTTFTEVHDIHCGDTMYISPLGYPTWNDPMIIDYPQSGFAQLLGDFVAANILEYQAPSFITTTDSVVIKCAHATQITCETGIYIFNVTCAVDSAAFDHTYTIPVECNDSIYSSTLSGWGIPLLQTAPEHGNATIIMEPTDGAGILYKPMQGYIGLDYATVSMFGGQVQVLYIFQVQCGISATNEPEPTAAKPMLVFPNPSIDGKTTIDVAPGGVLTAITIDGKQLPVMYKALDDEKIMAHGLRQLPQGLVVLQYRLGKEVYFAKYFVD